MKNILFFWFLFFSSVTLFNCTENKDGSGNLLGVGGGGNVAFKVAIVQDDQGTNFFGANPSVQVKITNVVVTQAQIPVNETITNPTPDDVVDPLEEGQYYGLYEVPQEAQTGQQWSFKFKGTIAKDGQAFEVTTNFTMQ